jgi:hypothetical protein
VNVELLIHAIVRQTTILIAQLATSHGIRAPLPHIADQVFADLVAELDRQGVSRKVSADMFGMGLRTYRRKVQRLRESSTMRGRSLWESVFAFIKEKGLTDRRQIVEHFTDDDEEQIKAVLYDLCESRLVMSSGTGARSIYRATTAEETLGPARSTAEVIDDDLLIALMYREAPLTLKQLAAMVQEEPASVEARVTRLVSDGRVQLVDDGGDARYSAQALVIPLGAEGGWEGAVFDHYKALVATVLSRLRNNQPTTPQDPIGGSTYTIEVWQGHPLEEEVLGTLGRARAAFSEMRNRVVQASETEVRPKLRKRVTIYVGQGVVEDEEDDHGN